VIHLPEPLSNNDRKEYTDTQSDAGDLWSTLLRQALAMTCPYIPSFIKIGSGIQKLIGGIHRHTDMMEFA
jgi:hypothetical protein